MPSPSDLHACSKTMFSPALSHLMIFGIILCVCIRSLKKGTSTFFCKSLVARKKLKTISLASSITSNQCCAPPILLLLGELMSMKNLSPIVVDLAILCFGTLF